MLLRKNILKTVLIDLDESISFAKITTENWTFGQGFARFTAHYQAVEQSRREMKRQRICFQ